MTTYSGQKYINTVSVAVFIYFFFNSQLVNAQAKNEISNRNQDIYNEGPPVTGGPSENDDRAKNDQLPEIVVTGSHIRGAQSSAGSTLITIDKNDIERSGYATTQQIIQSLPQNFNGGISEDTRLGADLVNNRTFSSGVNLRGLGNVGTLVLLNGRRMAGATSDGITPDISLIPTSAIERLEVLPDGASAVYGSDAVAGVVNFILKSDYDGAETRLRYGTVTSGSLDEYQISQDFGINWQNGNAFVTGEYYFRDSLKSSERDFSASADQRPNGGRDWRTFYSVPGNILSPDIPEPLYAIPLNQNGTKLTIKNLLPASNLNLFDANKYRELLPQQERYSAFTSITQELSSTFKLYTEFFFAERHFESAIVDTGTIISVPMSNAFYFDVYGDNEPVNVAYNFQNEWTNAFLKGNVKLYQATVGGQLSLSDNWRLKSYLMYSHNRSHVTSMGLNPSELEKAVADNDPNTALNVFGNGSSNNPETIKRIFSLELEQNHRQSLRNAQIVADGAAFELPAGDVKIGIGGEIIDIRLIGTESERFKRKLLAAFGEIYVPLFGEQNALPGLEELLLSFSIRSENYDDRQTDPVRGTKRTADTTNPKVGINWGLFPGFNVRSSYGTAFRAPSLTQLLTEKFVVYGPAPNPRSPTGLSNIILVQGTRPDIENEKAKTWSIGMDVRPEQLPGILLSATYYWIKFRDRILSVDDVPNMLAQPELYPGDAVAAPNLVEVQAACADATINFVPLNVCNSPELVDYILDARLGNRAVVKTDGIDVNIALAKETQKWGSFDVSANLNYIFKFLQSPTASAAPVDILNTLSNPNDFKARLGVSWNDGKGLSASVFWNYTDGYANQITEDNARVAAHSTYDLFIGFNTGSYLKARIFNELLFSLSIINIFDNDPPFVNNEFGYDLANGDPLGRFVSFNVSKKW